MSDRYWEAVEQQVATYRYVLNGGANDLVKNLLYANVMKNSLNPDPHNPATKRYIESLSAAIMGILLVPLGEGTPYYWSPELCPTLESLAAEVPLDWRLDPSLLPTEMGYLRFARPMPLPIYEGGDYMGPEDLIALTWTRANASFLGDPQLANNLCITFHTNDRRRPLGNPATTCPWPLGATLQQMLDEAQVSTAVKRDRNRTTERWKAKLSYFAAALSFMNSTCTTHHREPVPRSARRRLDREDPQRDPTVSVVRLRRPAARPDGPATFAEVDWSCRWVVHHHWRNQWYPADGVYRQIIIADYVKGPPDKPLRPPGRRIFSVDR